MRSAARSRSGGGSGEMAAAGLAAPEGGSAGMPLGTAVATAAAMCPPPPAGPGSWSRSLDRALEEAAASGTLSLSGRKLRDYPRASAANHDLSDTTRAGEGPGRAPGPGRGSPSHSLARGAEGAGARLSGWELPQGVLGGAGTPPRSPRLIFSPQERSERGFPAPRLCPEAMLVVLRLSGCFSLPALPLPLCRAPGLLRWASPPCPPAQKMSFFKRVLRGLSQRLLLAGGVLAGQELVRRCVCVCEHRWVSVCVHTHPQHPSLSTFCSVGRGKITLQAGWCV